MQCIFFFFSRFLLKKFSIRMSRRRSTPAFFRSICPRAAKSAMPNRVPNCSYLTPARASHYLDYAASIRVLLKKVVFLVSNHILRTDQFLQVAFLCLQFNDFLLYRPWYSVMDCFIGIAKAAYFWWPLEARTLPNTSLLCSHTNCALFSSTNSCAASIFIASELYFLLHSTVSYRETYVDRDDAEKLRKHDTSFLYVGSDPS